MATSLNRIGRQPLPPAAVEAGEAGDPLVDVPPGLRAAMLNLRRNPQPNQQAITREQAELLLRNMASGPENQPLQHRWESVFELPENISQLKQLARRYRFLIEKVPAVTFMAPLDDRADDRHELYISPQIESLLGFSQQEWLANPFLWYYRVHPEDREIWGQEFARTCASGVQFSAEYRMLARDGRAVWVHAECQLIRDEGGRPQFLLGIAFDVTDQKKVVELLETAQHHLERQVKERTAELMRANEALCGEMLERQRAQDDLLVAKEAAENAALHDKLTGLPNRALLQDRLARALERRQREKTHHFALFFLDLDRFKMVNDSLGHETGDALLVAIAHRLMQALRVTDSACTPDRSTVSRLGGDEFVVLADNLRDVRDAARIADRLVHALGQPYDLRGQSLVATVSIGVTTSFSDYTQPGDILRDADIAMYHAKAAGRAGFALFDRAMHEEIRDRMQLENELRQVLERNELELHYQPIVSLMNQSLLGLEALLRWRHPQRGMVPPAEFIGCAEETGLIVPIGAWVLGEATRQLAHWLKEHPKSAELYVTVNVSARQLLAPGFVDVVKKALADSSLSVQSIVLEVTETVMIRNADASIPVLQQLKDLGVRLFMDDFGTGYSSLSYLHRLPLSGLKIDRSFVKLMTEQRDYAAVVHAIVTLARNLNIALVAEGIETLEQVAMLQAMECEKAQGYFFSRPMDKATATNYLKTPVETIVTSRQQAAARRKPPG